MIVVNLTAEEAVILLQAVNHEKRLVGYYSTHRDGTPYVSQQQEVIKNLCNFLEVEILKEKNRDFVPDSKESWNAHKVAGDYEKGSGY